MPRGLMQHVVDPLAGRAACVSFRDRCFVKIDVLEERLEVLPHPRGEVVDHANRSTLPYEMLNEVRADEAGAPGYQERSVSKVNGENLMRCAARKPDYYAWTAAQ